jgi:amino acid transporter
VTTIAERITPGDAPVEKGLKAGALGLVSSVIMGVASTAPAYSLAATLGFIAVKVGLLSPLVVLLAFIPMLFISIGYSEMNKADPDCGTTFTWASRTFGPKTGWYGGWAIVAADVLVMASLAQVAGQYVFLLFGAHGIGSNATSGWVLLVGVAWIVAMTYICYRGIEVSAALQRVLLSIELAMLLVLSIVAFVKVGNGSAPVGHLAPAWSWFNPANISFSNMINGILLMIFIYWGWDTAVSVNEETKDPAKTPGQAAIISTILLVVTYFVVTLAAQSYAGTGTTGIGLQNVNHQGDVLSVLGGSVFGTSWAGGRLTSLLVLMVLSSAAASTQTTILPTARTTLSMAVYGGIPKSFAKMHQRYLTPTVSTLWMGGVSIVLYLILNYLSAGLIIADAVTALGIYIAFYYGLTGFSCVWYYRKVLNRSPRDLWMKGIIPLVGAAFLWFAMGWSIWSDWNYNNTTANSFTSWHLPFAPHSQVGGVFIIAVVMAVVGVALMILWMFTGGKDFFAGRTLNRFTPTLVPEDGGVPVGSPVGTGSQTSAVEDPGLTSKPMDGGPGTAT